METVSNYFNNNQTTWSEHISRQAISNQSASKYCREQGIHYKQFLYHRAKSRKNELSILTKSNKKSDSFIPVKIKENSSIKMFVSENVYFEMQDMPSVDWILELMRKA